MIDDWTGVSGGTYGDKAREYDWLGLSGLTVTDGLKGPVATIRWWETKHAQINTTFLTSQ